MVLNAETIFRDFSLDGVPTSGAHKPRKPDIRQWGAWLEAFIQAGGANGGLIYQTKAQLDADLARPANTSAWVIGDPVVANNGIYRKNGGVGTGSWTRVADLPYNFIRLTDAGAGTANAIIATSSIPLPASASAAILVMNVFEANTGNVTLAVNGAAAKPLLTSSGAQISPGGLTAGANIAFVDTGATFRLLSDQASAAIVAQAEAARDAAVSAAGANLANADSRAAAIVTNIPDPVKYVRTAGYAGAGDGGGALYKRVGAEPAHAGKFQSANGTWWEYADEVVNVMAFGALGDYNYSTNTGTDNAASFQAASSAATALKRDISFPPGYYLTNDGLTVPNRQTLRGAGRMCCKIVAKSSFNMAATAIVQLGTSGQNGTAIEDIAIDCIQPDSANRTDYIQYPPSVKTSGPRPRIRRVRIAAAWIGIDATANTGGANLEDIELSAFGKSIDLQGATDSVRLVNVHDWPFGVGEQSQMTTNQQAVRKDAENAGWLIGTTSSVSDLQSSACLILGLSNPLKLDGSGSFGNFSDLKLDIVQGPVSVSNGRWTFTAPHMSPAAGTNIQLFYQANGNVTVVDPHGVFAVGTTTGAIFQIRGGTFTCVGGRIQTGAAQCSPFIFEGTALFNIAGVLFDKNTNQTFTQAIIRTLDTASGTIVGCSVTPKGTGSGAFLTNSGTGTVVGVETCNTNGYSSPALWLSSTPAVSSSSGAFAIAPTASCQYLVRNGICQANFSITIAAAGNGSAAGDLIVTAPIPAASVVNGVGGGRQTNGSLLGVSALAVGSDIRLRSANGAYPGGDGVSIRFSIAYPI